VMGHEDQHGDILAHRNGCCVSQITTVPPAGVG
jgi:hypothetical protein